MIDELKKLEATLKLMTKYKVDSLELADGTKIIKSIHLGKESKAKNKKPMPAINTWTPEQLLFTAAGTIKKKIPQEAFNRYGAPYMINMDEVKENS